jgi:hypothetical protein
MHEIYLPVYGWQYSLIDHHACIVCDVSLVKSRQRRIQFDVMTLGNFSPICRKVIWSLVTGPYTMSFLFASAPPSYADEQLRAHLASLSVLSIAPSTDFQTADAKATPALESALHELTSSLAPDHDKLVAILKDLGKYKEGVSSYASGVDEQVEAEVMCRVVILVWKEVLQALVEGALQLEEERIWWDNSLNGRQGVIIYLIQSESCDDASRVERC